MDFKEALQSKNYKFITSFIINELDKEYYWAERSNLENIFYKNYFSRMKELIIEQTKLLDLGNNGDMVINLLNESILVEVLNVLNLSENDLQHINKDTFATIKKNSINNGYNFIKKSILDVSPEDFEMTILNKLHLMKFTLINLNDTNGLILFNRKFSDILLISCTEYSVENDIFESGKALFDILCENLSLGYYELSEMNSDRFNKFRDNILNKYK